MSEHPTPPGSATTQGQKACCLDSFMRVHARTVLRLGCDVVHDNTGRAVSQITCKTDRTRHDYHDFQNAGFCQKIAGIGTGVSAGHQCSKPLLAGGVPELQAQLPSLGCGGSSDCRWEPQLCLKREQLSNKVHANGGSVVLVKGPSKTLNENKHMTRSPALLCTNCRMSAVLPVPHCPRKTT